MALSNAERQRQYIARLKGKAAVTDGSVTNEFVRLKAFASQLERENVTLKEKVAALKKEQAAAKRREDDLHIEVSKLKATNSWFAPSGATMTAAQFNAILKCLHPDSLCATSSGRRLRLGADRASRRAEKRHRGCRAAYLLLESKWE